MSVSQIFRLPAPMSLKQLRMPVNMGCDSLPMPPSESGASSLNHGHSMKTRFHEFLRRAPFPFMPERICCYGFNQCSSSRELLPLW